MEQPHFPPRHLYVGAVVSRKASPEVTHFAEVFSEFRYILHCY